MHPHRSHDAKQSTFAAITTAIVASARSPLPLWPAFLLQVVVAAVGIVICYADRSNMSTAILSMAETYHWDKVGACQSLP